MRDYRTFLTDSVGEFVVNKSRFIGSGFCVNSQKEAEDILQSVRKKYYDATHNCYAYIVGENSENPKSSDDGEPSGTAGKPMLEYLKNNSLTNCLVTGTRYFGGIKLGTGGLSRAYGDCAKIAAANNTIVEKRVFTKANVTFDYTYLEKIQNYIKKNELISRPPEFAENVLIPVFMRDEKLKQICDNLNDLTAGEVKIEPKNQVYLNFVDEVFDEKSSFM